MDAVEVSRAAVEQAVNAINFQTNVFEKWLYLGEVSSVEEALQFSAEVEMLKRTAQCLQSALAA